MIKRWDLTDTLFCDDEATAMAEHKQGDYIEYEDYEKLLKLSEQMLEDLIGEGMHTQKYEDEMKIIRGEFNMDDLHNSIMQPVIERCKKALEATNER